VKVQPTTTRRKINRIQLSSYKRRGKGPVASSYLEPKSSLKKGGGNSVIGGKEIISLLGKGVATGVAQMKDHFVSQKRGKKRE